MEKQEAVVYQFPMSARTKIASLTDEAGSIPVGAQDSRKGQPREFLKIGRKVLNETELASPAAGRFMIAEIERLDGECTQLRAIANSYYDLRVEHATLAANAKTSRWFEILSSACLIGGSVGIGGAPSYLEVANLHGLGWTLLIGSALLTGAGILSRIFR